MQSVKTVIIPAAGMGNRLGSLTEDKPKCLVDVNGEPILKQSLDALQEFGFERIIIITGFMEESIMGFIGRYNGAMRIETVHNNEFDKTNNIYSLFVSFPLLKDDEPFVILESDLIFEKSCIAAFRKPDLIALDPYNPEIHNGTTACVSPEGYVEALYTEKDDATIQDLYKTVNITSFSSKNAALFKKYVSLYVNQGRVNDYYEAAIESMISLNNAKFKAVSFKDKIWGEIDTQEDYSRVSNQFDVEQITR